MIRYIILEANPRASRTVPLVSKVCNISMARIATQLMLGKKLADLNIKPKSIPHFGVKEAVFPFNMFPEVDPLLGPEMRSTGEVLGMADSFGLAFYKAQEAAQQFCRRRERCLLRCLREIDRRCWKWRVNFINSVLKSRPQTALTNSWTSRALNLNIFSKCMKDAQISWMASRTMKSSCSSIHPAAN